MFLTGGKPMADKNIQMGQRNESNTEWDNHYPITKAENVLTEGGTVASQLAEIPNRIDEKTINKADKVYVDEKLATKTDKEEVNYLLGNISDGTPKFASNIEEMTDATRLYVNLEDGYLYYSNGTTWESTGVLYQATGSNEFVAENIIVNGNFENDSEWLAGGIGTSLTIANNEAYIIGTDSVAALRQINKKIVAGHKYYMSALVKSLSKNTALTLYDGAAFNKGAWHSGSNEYERLSSILVPLNSTNSGQFQIRGGATNGVYVKHFIVIDLTVMFGLGNEPDVEEFSELLSYKLENQWFDGRVAPFLDNRELYQYCNMKLNKAADATLQHIGFINNPTSADYTGQAMITLSYDDGYLNNYFLALPLHEKYGIPATFNIPANRPITESYHDRFFDVLITRECHERGVEIASHAYQHGRYTEKTDEEIHFDMSESIRVLDEITGVPTATIAIPNSDYDERVENIAKQYFKGVRVYGNELNSIPAENRYHLKSAIAVTNTTSFEAVKTIIDNAIAQNKWAILMFHGVKNAPLSDRTLYQVTPQLLDQILKYINEQGRDKLLPVNTRDGLKISLGDSY